MIADATIKADLVQQWTVVRKLCSDVQAVYQTPGGVINETRPLDSFNLPFVLAFAVLDQVLTALQAQGLFVAQWPLGAKMSASKPVLPWQDYALVFAGKEARNDLAHEARLASKADCLRYVQAIENELKAWGVV